MYKKIGTFVFSLIVSTLSLSSQEVLSYELKKDYSSAEQAQKKTTAAVSEQYKKALEELKALLPPLSDQDLAEIMRLSKKGRMLLLFGGENFDRFIGCLNCRSDVSISVWNSKGKYGSPYSTESIWNSLSEAGSPVSRLSPWSPYASKPPLILDNTGKDYGLLTVNLRHKFRAVGGLAATLCKYSGRISENPERWYKAIFKDNLNEVFTVPETAAAEDDAAEAAAKVKAKAENKDSNGTQTVSSDNKDSLKKDGEAKAVKSTGGSDSAGGTLKAGTAYEDSFETEISESKTEYTEQHTADGEASHTKREEIKSATSSAENKELSKPYDINSGKAVKTDNISDKPASAQASVNHNTNPAVKTALPSGSNVFKAPETEKAGFIISPAEEKAEQDSAQHIVEESEGEVLIITG